MYEYDERNDISLFTYDLAIYQESDEGKKIEKMLTETDDGFMARDYTTTTAEQLKTAMLNYWDGRNVTGLHYDGAVVPEVA